MTSTRSAKWVLFSALQREGRRMSVWLALFPFLGFLYALCHGLLQALMNQDTDTVAAQDQTVRIFGSIALFLTAATIMAGAFFAISAFRFLYSRRQSDFYLSLPVTRRTFYFVKWVIGELVLLLAFCGAGIGCWLVPQLIPRKWHVQLDAGYGLRLLTVAFAAAAAFYCICLLCAVTAGKVWQYWSLLIGFGGCLPLGLISYAELFPAFLSGLNQQPVRIVALVSPIAYVPFGVQGVFDFRYLLLAALLVDVLLCNVFIKNLVARTRPFDVNTAVQLLVAKPRDYSFPSGHTAASFASVTALYLAGEKKMWKAALVLAVLIALSRLYL